MSKLNWLHLSDWHQKGKDFDREVVCNALIEDIRNRTKIDPDLEQIDFIVFSGDVAFHGKTVEYKAARKNLFDPVLEATGLSSDRLFIVPGNHDLDRNWVSKMLPGALQKILNEEECKDWLTDEVCRSRLLEPFKAFSTFVSAYTGQDSPEYASIRMWSDIGGKKVALLGLNSAWMCGRNKDDKGEVNDYGYTLLGEPQIYQALTHIADADVRLVILHHSFDWLAEFDRHRVEERLGKYAHFILCGHQHFPQIKITQGTSGEYVLIPAGACYDRRLPSDPRYTNAYNFVHFDCEDRRGSVYLRRWNNVRNSWIQDVYSTEKDGRLVFELPDSGKSKRKDDHNGSDIHSESPPLHNLPQPEYKHFVGREFELGEVIKLLAPTSDSSVVAITGFGGIGKTTLALEVAHKFLREYSKLSDRRFDALVWVSAKQTVLIGGKQLNCPDFLKTLDDVYRAIAITLRRENILSAPLKERHERIRQALSQQRTLLIIDNFDAINLKHQEDILVFIQQVTNPTKVIVTSRITLDILYPIHLAALDKPEALDLITDQTNWRKIELSPNQRELLFEHTGGMPVAIVWSVNEVARGYEINHILSRLKHQQTGNLANFCVLESINSIFGKNSYRVLMALALFDPDASREALGKIVNLTDSERDDGLVELRKLLLVRGNQRFSLLPFTREVSLNELRTRQDLEGPLRQAFVAYFLDICRQFGGYQWDLYNQLDQDLKNIQWALEWAYQLEMWNEVAEFVSCIDVYLNRRGLWNELVVYAEKALIASKHIGNNRLVIRNLIFGLGWAKAFRFGMLDEALESIQKGKNMAQILDYKVEYLIALRNEGVVYRYLGKHEDACVSLRESLRISEELADSDWEIRVLGSLGENEIAIGNFEKATKYYERAVKRSRETKEKYQLALNLIRISDVLRHVNELDKAYSYAIESLSIFKTINHPYDIAICYLILGRAEYALGKVENAISSVRYAQKKFADLGVEDRLMEAEDFLKEQEDLEPWQAADCGRKLHGTNLLSNE